MEVIGRLVAAGVFFATGCGSVASEAPSHARHASASASIEVERIDGGFTVKNLTSATIRCGAVSSIGWSPRETVQVAPRDTARIVDNARQILACEVDLKAAAEMSGETEDELRTSLGASRSEKLVIFEDRGQVSSSTVALASSCNTEPSD